MRGVCEHIAVCHIETPYKPRPLMTKFASTSEKGLSTYPAYRGTEGHLFQLSPHTCQTDPILRESRKGLSAKTWKCQEPLPFRQALGWPLPSWIDWSCLVAFICNASLSNDGEWYVGHSMMVNVIWPRGGGDHLLRKPSCLLHVPRDD